MEYQVMTEEFSGPLDLLLHLIKEHDMDLMDLDVSVICTQYLEYIETMDSHLLETVSEYLVMASWLIEMKSRLLLRDETIDEEDDFEEKRQAMIEALLEKKRINEVLGDFEERYLHRQGMHTKIPNLDHYIIDNEDKIPEDLEVYDLIAAMQKVIQRRLLLQPLESKIRRVEITVDERVTQIEDFFSKHKGERIDFERLFVKEDKYFAIVTFLSVLVLVKNRRLDISQDKNFDTIYLKGR